MNVHTRGALNSWLSPINTFSISTLVGMEIVSISRHHRLLFVRCVASTPPPPHTQRGARRRFCRKQERNYLTQKITSFIANNYQHKMFYGSEVLSLRCACNASTQNSIKRNCGEAAVRRVRVVV